MRGFRACLKIHSRILHDVSFRCFMPCFRPNLIKTLVKAFHAPDLHCKSVCIGDCCPQNRGVRFPEEMWAGWKEKDGKENGNGI